eukprot:m.173653 g.173653  ORF g.173653 m.173653 type:complete len:274 (-) comp16533_c9_seq5:42-863(-)
MILTKSSKNRQYGRVKDFRREAGWGFIQKFPTLEDVFLHSSNLLDGDDIHKGAWVEFGTQASPRGLMATRVSKTTQSEVDSILVKGPTTYEGIVDTPVTSHTTAGRILYDVSVDKHNNEGRTAPHVQVMSGSRERQDKQGATQQNVAVFSVTSISKGEGIPAKDDRVSFKLIQGTSYAVDIRKLAGPTSRAVVVTGTINKLFDRYAGIRFQLPGHSTSMARKFMHQQYLGDYSKLKPKQTVRVSLDVSGEEDDSLMNMLQVRIASVLPPLPDQ